MKDQSFSEMENRTLTQKPKFSVERLLEGRYTTKYEKYVNDQFYGRDWWVRLKSSVDLFLNKRENNGVYYGEDGYLIEDFTPGTEVAINQNIQAINAFYKKHENMKHYFLMVPNAISILSDKLPQHVPTINQETYMDELEKNLNLGLTFINPTDSLKQHQEEKLFYKTDHHWTTLGAYYTFLEVAEAIGFSVDDDYRVETVTSAFNGTLTSSSGYGVRDLDNIEVYLPNDETNQVVVNYVEEQKRTATLYDVTKLQGKDKYATFLGGNHSLVKIMTTSMSEKKLLLIKDSYANAFVPFLTSYYSEIVMVDPRYYFEDIELLIESEGFTDVLYLYNVNSFFSDNSLNLVLNNE